jgi:hypothetical protein
MNDPSMRLLIFGLRRDTCESDLRGLLGRCGQARLDLLELPGDNDEAYAVVHLVPDAALAWRLARGINTRQLHGRRLQSWVPVMAWS